MACSIDGNPEIVNELLATVSIVVNSATELSELFYCIKSGCGGGGGGANNNIHTNNNTTNLLHLLRM